MNYVFVRPHAYDCLYERLGLIMSLMYACYESSAHLCLSSEYQFLVAFRFSAPHTCHHRTVTPPNTTINEKCSCMTFVVHTIPSNMRCR